MLSVGRVQTPVLGLVVRRDEEIENFVPRDYFTLDALIPYQEGARQFDIRARWKPSEACKPLARRRGQSSQSKAGRERLQAELPIKRPRLLNQSKNKLSSSHRYRILLCVTNRRCQALWYERSASSRHLSVLV